MEWISINDSLPKKEAEVNTLWFDVWTTDRVRIPDVKFREDGQFYKQMLDYEGDYDHDELIENVTHWLEVEPPK
jgi:hypothetical protein